MATKLPATDIVIIGLGWTGSIVAKSMTEAGFDVVAIERGPWRDTATDFPPTYSPDELRYAMRHDLFLRPTRTTLTFRNNTSQTALPIRSWGAFLLPNGVGGAGGALECGDLALSAERLCLENAPDPALRREIPARGHDDPGLGRHLRRARAAL